MADPSGQSYANHARYVPLFHFVLLGILTVNFLWCAYRAVVAFSWPTLLAASMGFAFLLMFLYIRTFLWPSRTASSASKCASGSSVSCPRNGRHGSRRSGPVS